LPGEQKEIFILNEFEGFSVKKISEMKNEPVNTLISRKQYAVLYLRKRSKYLIEELKKQCVEVIITNSGFSLELCFELDFVLQ
jgi:hypothetical protein